MLYSSLHIATIYNKENQRRGKMSEDTKEMMAYEGFLRNMTEDEFLEEFHEMQDKIRVLNFESAMRGVYDTSV
jgi:hypothetical protein